MEDPTPVCRFAGCGREVYAKKRQLCRTHTRQAQTGQPLRPLQIKVKSGGPCSFEGCPTPAKNRGWCKSHYDQIRLGRVLRMPRKKYPRAARDELGRKRCGGCEEWKPEAAFASSKGKADGLQWRCRECNARIYRGRSEQVRDKMREQRFGITRAEFDALFESQGKVCAICGGDNPDRNYWATDHDHSCCPAAGESCGKCIRGILCGPCNRGLGSFRDDPARLTAALAYLARGVR